MAKKGQNQSSWNWQSYDRDQGIIPNGEDREIENFDLAEELDKVEGELKPAGRGRTQIQRFRTQSKLNQTEDLGFVHSHKSPLSHSKSRKGEDRQLQSPDVKGSRRLVTPSTLSSVKQQNSINPRSSSRL